MTTRTYTPRERIVFSAAQLIRLRGVDGTGMREVVERADAPRGSLQHYFPGGKDQLVGEAVAWGARYASRRVERFVADLRKPTPAKLFAAMAQQWIDEYRTSGFEAGCPIAAVTVDCAQGSDQLRQVAAQAFDQWRTPVARALADMGVARRRAAALATLMISALEGAILMARAERDVAPLRTVVRELGPVLDAAVA